MKNLNLKSMIIPVVLSLVVLAGCKKTVELANNAQPNTDVYSVDNLINSADVSFLSDNIIDGTENDAFAAENEGLPEAYTIVEMDMDNAGFKRTNTKRIFMCLKKRNLSDTQIMQIRMATRDYEKCKMGSIRKHRDAYDSLFKKIENLRKEYVAQLKNGKITRSEFEKKMKELNIRFRNSLKEIKLRNAKSLRHCYELYLKSIKNILTDAQWKAFVECYR